MVVSRNLIEQILLILFIYFSLTVHIKINYFVILLYMQKIEKFL